MIPARVTTASVDEASVQARDEKAAATQCPPQEEKLLDEGILQAIEENAAALALSSLPLGGPVGVMLCLLSSEGGRV